MSELRLDGISLSYDRGRAQLGPRVLDNVTLSVGADEFVAVLGQSGSGKTSLLNIAAGFIEPSAGRVTIDGLAQTGPGAGRAVVFQDDALFAWLNARDNVALPLRLRGLDVRERRQQADAMLAQVGLEGQGGKAIWTLSGGMRQRVGIARALASEPRFLLMDEPLGALDAMTRERMQELLLRAWRTSRAGALLITHSVEEALFVATRVIVLAPHPGRIVESLDVDFGTRFLDGEAARAIKSDPAFIAIRERLIDAIHETELRVAS